MIDRAPDKITPQIEQILASQNFIIDYKNLKVREAGATLFANFTIKVDPNLSIGKAHALADEIEIKIKSAFPNSEIYIHIEPTELPDYMFS